MCARGGPAGAGEVIGAVAASKSRRVRAHLHLLLLAISPNGDDDVAGGGGGGPAAAPTNPPAAVAEGHAEAVACGACSYRGRHARLAGSGWVGRDRNAGVPAAGSDGVHGSEGRGGDGGGGGGGGGRLGAGLRNNGQGQILARLAGVGCQFNVVGRAWVGMGGHGRARVCMAAPTGDGIRLGPIGAHARCLEKGP